MNEKINWVKGGEERKEGVYLDFACLSDFTLGPPFHLWSGSALRLSLRVLYLVFQLCAGGFRNTGFTGFLGFLGFDPFREISLCLFIGLRVGALHVFNHGVGHSATVTA